MLHRLLGWAYDFGVTYACVGDRMWIGTHHRSCGTSTTRGRLSLLFPQMWICDTTTIITIKKQTKSFLGFQNLSAAKTCEQTKNLSSVSICTVPSCTARSQFSSTDSLVQGRRAGGFHLAKNTGGLCGPVYAQRLPSIVFGDRGNAT
jgi:hypothetical protein